MNKVGSVSVVEVGRGTGACMDGAGGRRRWGSGREQVSIGVGGTKIPLYIYVDVPGLSWASIFASRSVQLVMNIATNPSCIFFCLVQNTSNL
jgi:hypothetical protein